FILLVPSLLSISFLFVTLPAATAIYTLSLHDALPILLGVATTSLAEGLARERLACSTSRLVMRPSCAATAPRSMPASRASARAADRKSTRLNSSHVKISYAVFCLKKKKKINKTLQITL